MKELIESTFGKHVWTLVEHKRVRSVYALSNGGAPEFYAKICHPDSLLRKLQNTAFPKSVKEARILGVLRDSGIAVPEVAACLRRGPESALVTKAVHPCTALASLPEDRQIEIMLSVAARLMEKGFFYRDCHAGNIILDGAGEPVLVDAYAVQPVSSVREKHLIRLFGQITSTYRVDDKVLRQYVDGLLPGRDNTRIVEAVQNTGLLFRRRLVQRRVNRTLREGSFSQEKKTSAYRAFISRSHDLHLDEVIDRHERNLAEGCNILKYQEKTQLSSVGDLCVKSYARPKPLCPAYGLRSWKGLMTLCFNGIPTAEPVAVVVRKDGTSILITKLIPGRDLNRVLYHDYPLMGARQKLALARELGKLIGRMHMYRIYHADLKTSNIKVAGYPASFVLMDTDKVSQARSLSRRRRIKNMVQINTTVPRHISRSTRMAFIHAYAEFTGDDPRGLFRSVWKASSHMTIAYGTDEGGRSERW